MAEACLSGKTEEWCLASGQPAIKGWAQPKENINGCFGEYEKGSL